MINKLIILQFVTFAALIIILRFLFYRNLNSALRRLKELHEQNQIKESQLREELERAKQEHDSEVERGKAEAEKIITEAKRIGEILKRNLQDQARIEADRLLQEGREHLEKQKKEYLAKIELRAVELATEMIKYTLTAQMGEQLHHELIQEIIEEIDKIDKQKFTVKKETVKIISGKSLVAEEKDKLKNILSRKLDLNVVLEEEVKPKIVGGLVVEIGAFVIDGSLKNKLKKSIPFIRKDELGS